LRLIRSQQRPAQQVRCIAVYHEKLEMERTMLPIIGFVIVSVVTVGGAQVWCLAQSPPRPLIAQIAPTQRQAVQPKVWVKSPTAEHALAEQATPASAIDEPTDHLLDRHLALSGVALGTTCAGHFLYPPLGILTTPLIVYLEWPIFQAAWRSGPKAQPQD
jgi:hypothetical protein